MRSFIDIVSEQAPAADSTVMHQAGDFTLTVSIRGGKEIFELFSVSAHKKIGIFVVDLSQKDKGVANVHSEISKSYRRKGLGTMVYDWVERYVAKQGLKLSPSPLLSTASYPFWKKRDPDSVKHHDPDNLYHGYEMRDDDCDCDPETDEDCYCDDDEIWAEQ